MTKNCVLASDFLENERFPERFPAVSYGFPEVSAVSGNFPLRFSMHRQQKRWFPIGFLKFPRFRAVFFCVSRCTESTNCQN